MSTGASVGQTNNPTGPGEAAGHGMGITPMYSRGLMSPYAPPQTNAPGFFGGPPSGGQALGGGQQQGQMMQGLGSLMNMPSQLAPQQQGQGQGFFGGTGPRIPLMMDSLPPSGQVNGVFGGQIAPPGTLVPLGNNGAMFNQAVAALPPAPPVLRGT